MDERVQKKLPLIQFQVDESLPHFVIPGTLSSYNEYIRECRANPYQGNKKKVRDMEYAMWHMDEVAGEHFDRIILHYRFFEPKKNRDKDNIFGYANKVIADALQEMKVIDNDGWKNIENFTHDFFVDKEFPRIEVYIENVD